jgi:DUF1016 N-terminal domain
MTTKKNRSATNTPLYGRIRKIIDAGREETCQPRQLPPGLSWSHYRALVKLARIDERNVYEIEAVKNSWSARELERQIIGCCYVLSP